jgi:hypothetical protein
MFFKWDQSIYSGFYRVLFWGVIEPECRVLSPSSSWNPKHAHMLQNFCSYRNSRNPPNCWDPKHP